MTMAIRRRIRADLGGLEGAVTWVNMVWFSACPLMVSLKALMVSVRMSAGIPEAIRVSHSLERRPHCWTVV